jgi:hypothetical protein
MRSITIVLLFALGVAALAQNPQPLVTVVTGPPPMLDTGLPNLYYPTPPPPS